jgi:hypothetical protein
VFLRIQNRGVGVPRSLGFRFHGTRNLPEDVFYVFSNALLSEYNLSLIFEQVAMGSRVPKNGEPTRVPGSQEQGTHPGSGFRVLGNGNPYSSAFLGFRVSKNGEPARIRSPRSFENRVPIHKNPSGFRVLGNGEPIVDFAFPVPENGEPACVPVPGNPEPACVPRSRERNPKLTPLIQNREQSCFQISYRYHIKNCS